MGRTVGIDLGTTYSLIAYQDKRDGRAEVYSGAVWHAAVPFGGERGRGRLDHRGRTGAARAC